MDQMKKQATTDLIVIGGGPAGVTAALRARELGAAVVLVERSRMVVSLWLKVRQR